MSISAQQLSNFCNITEAIRAQIEQVLQEKVQEGYHVDHEMGLLDLSPESVEIGCGSFLKTQGDETITVFCHHWKLTLSGEFVTFPEIYHFYLGVNEIDGQMAPSYTYEKVKERLDNLYSF